MTSVILKYSVWLLGCAMAKKKRRLESVASAAVSVGHRLLGGMQQEA